MKQAGEVRIVGFWIRFCAGSFDVVLVALFIVAVRFVAIKLKWYVPVELATLLTIPAYFSVAHLWKAQTVGKWLCGIAIVRSDGNRGRFVQVVLRETLWKLVSVLPLGAGFLWCCLSRQKRSLHDYLAGTVVTSCPMPLGRWGRTLAWLIVIGVTVISLDVRGLIAIGNDYAAMRTVETVVFPFEQRNPSLLIEAAFVGESQLDLYSQWLHENEIDPIEYAVSKAQQHQVLVFGEVHEKKESLEYLHNLIPELYHRAGVTIVAMEVCLAQDNDQLEHLVLGETFDRELAMEIARHQPWGIWGFKEYWDVLEIVWCLNKTIPDGQQKVLVIGLDAPMDMQSVGMIGFEDNPAKYCSLWEKLRVVRLPRILLKVLARDIRMARQIELQILEKGNKAIVWVGAQHAWASPQVVSSGGFRMTRMGAMLRQRYGERLFFVRLHGYDIPVSLVDRTYYGPEPTIGSTIEKMMLRSGLSKTAFDTATSPLGYLRDAASFDYHYEPRLGMQDIADGYVYLRSWGDYSQCGWLDGYVTPQMFAANKPFYQAFGRKAGEFLKNADEVNRFFADQ